ncbi:MAG: hypothetical protein EAZ78_26185 [Oscillatoriales cyanobacterium]|nr:MAG: hypothetical protein EAZ96_26050 [Oscillatoriales cyanobacterium]TAE97143.1 MAG: hypothetical protein EAZ78_26185 [Oscillatoriales cyanobacterium]TAF31031.1 MAG: hypothetical protein EAZ68_22250 [Oscillatoriales cyanobacterium]TAF68872.1 MAG: hypothetical protein EAZ59_10025 [Oscillatoriales cyanobacterium]
MGLGMVGDFLYYAKLFCKYALATGFPACSTKSEFLGKFRFRAMNRLCAILAREILLNFF